MIDTVILQIPYMDYIITDHEQFNPPTYNIASSRTLLLKHVNNPTSQDKKNKIYKPRLTIMKRSRTEIPLKIEFSIPKLLFGNNVDEVHDADLPRAVSELHKKLLIMGVSIKNEALMRARVLTVHYSRNITLNNGYTASFVIKELAKVNLTHQLDLSKTEFRNEGNSLQYYSKSHSFVIYDKIKDLKQGQGRSIDKDQNHLQSTIFDQIQESRPETELLRFEVRLCNRRKLKTILKKVGHEQDNPILCNLFRSKISQAVITHYWQTMVIEKNRFLFIATNDPLQTLKTMLQAKLSPNKAFYLIGLLTLSKAKGVREIRKVLGEHNSSRTWYRIQKDLKQLNGLAMTNTSFGFIEDIESSLRNFKPYKLPKDSPLSLC